MRSVLVRSGILLCGIALSNIMAVTSAFSQTLISKKDFDDRYGIFISQNLLLSKKKLNENIFGNSTSSQKIFQVSKDAKSNKICHLKVVLFLGYDVRSSGSRDDSIGPADGMGILQSHLREEVSKISGISLSSRVYRWNAEDAALADIKRAIANGEADSVVLIGHSFGADEANALADTLNGEDVNVDVLIQIDSVGTYDDNFPNNVTALINYYQTNDQSALVEYEIPGAVNIDATKEFDSRLHHRSIDNNADLHQDAIRRILDGTCNEQDNYGFIEGRLTYPSEYIPPFRVCAQLITNYYLMNCIDTTENQNSFRLAVDPGPYFVFSYRENSFKDPDTDKYFDAFFYYASGNNQAGLPIIVQVTAGRTVTGISLENYAICNPRFGTPPSYCIAPPKTNSPSQSSENRQYTYAGWFTYQPADGSYKVRFPGRPQMQDRIQVVLDNGSRAYLTRKDNISIPNDEQVDIEAILEGARNGLSQSGTIRREFYIESNGIPVREILVEGENGEFLKARVFFDVDNGRLYQAIVGTVDGSLPSNADAFLQSFEVVK